MLNREQLETFAAVVDAGSFERAAAVLNVTRSAISQRIKALEESVATVLLLREKPVVPTVGGEVLLRHVKALRLFEDAVLASLLPDTRGREAVPLAISVNADSLATWFPGVLWPLLRKRRIALEVVTDDQDHTLARLARGEVIGCLSTENKPTTGFVAEPLGMMEYRCFATKWFVEQYFPRGVTVQSVLAAPAVLFNRKDALHDEFLASLFGFRIERYARHYLPAPGTLMDGVRAGIGYGLVPMMQVETLPNREDLVDLVPDKPVLVDLYWHHWEVEPPLSREITEHVLDEASRSLERPRAPEPGAVADAHPKAQQHETGSAEA